MPSDPVGPVENFIKGEEQEKGRGGEARGPAICLAFNPALGPTSKRLPSIDCDYVTQVSEW
jgi:hypothetical protein